MLLKHGEYRKIIIQEIFENLVPKFQTEIVITTFIV